MNNNRYNKNLNFGIRFSNIIFLAISVFFFFILVFASYKIYINSFGNFSDHRFNLQFYILCIAFSLVVIILLIIGYFRLKDSVKINLSILLLTIGFSFFAFEIYLNLSKIMNSCGEDTRCGAAKEMKIFYDKRSLKEVMDDLKDQGQQLYSNYWPSMLLDLNGLSLDKDEGKIFPLGGISNISTILFNEAGYYPIIKTDEHGFNNPAGLYVKGQKDIVLIGDSFVEGYSVKADETMSAFFRELGFDVFNFGKGDSGTLVQFATFKEYAIHYKPKTVLWFYYGNDIYDLEKEIGSSILMNYLNYQDYSQNLMSKQIEIDKLLINYISQKDKNRNQKQFLNKTLFKIIKLSYTREKIKLILVRFQKLLQKERQTSIEIKSSSANRNKIISNREKIFKQILIESKKLVEEWGGKMYFIFLPAFESDSLGNENKYKHHVFKSFNEEEEYRQFIFNLLIEENIPFIDILDEVINLHSDPISICPLRRCGHYNTEGYKLITETIIKRLKKDQIPGF